MFSGLSSGITDFQLLPKILYLIWFRRLAWPLQKLEMLLDLRKFLRSNSVVAQVVYLELLSCYDPPVFHPQYTHWLKEVSRSQSCRPLVHPDGVWPTCLPDMFWQKAFVTVVTTLHTQYTSRFFENHIMRFSGFFFSFNILSVIVEAYLLWT